MEAKKGSDLKAFILVFILVVLGSFLAYMYLYMPLAREKDALLKENFDLESRYIELKNMESEMKGDFITNIKKSSSEMQTLLNHYSAGNTPEKSIMMTKMVEDKIGIKLPNLTFSQPSVLSNVKMPIISDTETGEYTIAYHDVTLYGETLATNYSCSYEQLKKLVDFINAYPERMNIESISMSYNKATGELQGSLILNLYAVTGTGKEYVPPVINDLSMGEENIFE